MRIVFTGDREVTTADKWLVDDLIKAIQAEGPIKVQNGRRIDEASINPHEVAYVAPIPKPSLHFQLPPFVPSKWKIGSNPRAG